MLFDWDPNKSAHNSEKHGIDFDEARWLWGDANRVEFRIRVSGEQRYGVLARHGGSVWLAVTTRRGEAIRIISVRRATRKEAALYDKVNGQR